MTEQKFAIELKAASTEEFKVERSLHDKIGPINPQKINVQLGFQFHHEIVKDIFTVTVLVVYQYPTNPSNNEHIELMKFQAGFDFTVTNLKTILKPNQSGFQMPDNVMMAIVGVSISTARGMLIPLTAGSYLNSFILPIVDTKEMLENLKIKKTPIENELHVQGQQQLTKRKPKQSR
ncbi:hypothetical protein [Phnomibacter ginsenosidimutans]|uniref:Preprotein translocase subunit SecB n=1 Tax=Phnomibacter ginsenosidimutans TaxID=2676868 RepID=A0A6I6GT32_9BACT|nr:hypothetical protein [Phnomibacter ginsenosidimutans]QGW28319.1 hypothetical protein GLV81_09605 [Phnomibacter ginsenosidimutans]